MFQIRTVLCPVDFTERDDRALDLAIEVCRSFDARLILHHNVGNAPAGPAVSWMYHQEHQNGHRPEEMASNKLREMLASFPSELRAEARLSNSVTVAAIRHLEEELRADLVILATHGASTEDHASITEEIVEESVCPVLVLHEDRRPTLHIQPGETRIFDVLVPTDFSPSGDRAVAYAFEMARILPFRLHLLHVIPPRKTVRIATGVSMTPALLYKEEPVEEMKARLAALVPQDLENRVNLRVEVGEPAEKIAEAASSLGASCIVMGAHARSFLRRYFTRNTSRALLHAASCPVWFVPEAEAA